ncbi:hypothetical protein LLG07_03225 [bacterium]|nr:hypothetical protein [bacterium]
MEENNKKDNPESVKAPNTPNRNYDDRDYGYRSHRVDHNEESYENKRGRRAFSYVWNIIWSLVFIIFFNFFSSYIAYYQYEQSDGSLVWHRFSIITGDFSKLVPLITAGLFIIIVGNIILLIFDRYILAKIVEIVCAIFAVAVIANFLLLFPIDFNIIPYDKVAELLPLILKIASGLIILILVIQIIANFVRIVVKITKK